jgi:hypothetical protein
MECHLQAINGAIDNTAIKTEQEATQSGDNADNNDRGHVSLVG